MANWYVDSAATGNGVGTSLLNAWTSFGSIAQSGLRASDVVWVYPGTGSYVIGQHSITTGGAHTGARIIYKGVNSPVLVGGFTATARHCLGFLGFEITQLTGNNYAAFTLNNCSGWLIQDNYVHDTQGGGVNAAFGTINSNNVVRANRFHNLCSLSGGRSSAPVITLFGDYNLVEYNSITSGLDRTRAFGTGNIIRNNYFGPTDAILYPNTSPYPHHTDSFQSFASSLTLSKLIYERNWDVDNRDSEDGTNAHGFLIQDEAGGIGMNWGIARFNVLVRPGGVAYQFKDFDRFYGYNLTSVGVETGSSILANSAVTYETPLCDIQDWRNNTWSFSPRTVSDSGIFSANRPTNFTAEYQHRYDAGVLPNASNNLPNTDPLFADLAADDYKLQTTSPLVNSGGPLTFASGAGTDSTDLFVDDAYRFFDGWGMADADIIKVGNGAYVRVSGINYAVNRITLSAARSWSNNDPVRVKGMEDVGALPFGYASGIQIVNTTPTDLPVGPVTLSATTLVPDAVRKVEFLVDGLPVGEVLQAPYEVTWTNDGATHTIEARAYNMWASQTLTASSFWPYKRFRRLGGRLKLRGWSAN